MTCTVRVQVVCEFNRELPIENYLTKDSKGFNMLTDKGIAKIIKPIEDEYCDIFGEAEVISVAPYNEDAIYEM